MNPYRARDKRIKKLGFRDYKHYLESGVWQTIRKMVLERDQHTCLLCTKRANQVHHIKYNPRTLMGKNLRWLISLCSLCHTSLEFDESGKKRSLKLVTKALSEHPHYQQLPIFEPQRVKAYRRKSISIAMNKKCY